MLNKKLFMLENIYLVRLIHKIVNNEQKSTRQYINVHDNFLYSILKVDAQDK